MRTSDEDQIKDAVFKKVITEVVSLEGRNHTINIDSTTTASYRVNVSQIRPVPVDLDDTKAVDSVSVLSAINDAEPWPQIEK